MSNSIIPLIAFASCEEEKEEWSKCCDCTIDSWIGIFKGKDDYFKSSGNLKIEGQYSLTHPSLSLRVATEAHEIATENGDLLQISKTLKQRTQLFEKESKLREVEKARLEDQLFAEQEINKLQTEKLEQKNRELSARILHIINKNEAMTNIINELEKIKEKQPGDFQHCFVKVNQIVKENISTDKEWKQFKLHFEEVNPGFFHNLQEKYPQLTQNELKLCAYYRINLGTKEIAKILNVTPSAIQKSRHRLRKKMDIPSQTELPEFVSRF